METSKYILHVNWVDGLEEYVATIRRISDNAKMFEAGYEAIDDAVYEGEQTLLSYEYNRGGW
jgi:hypothetical protein